MSGTRNPAIRVLTLAMLVGLAGWAVSQTSTVGQESGEAALPRGFRNPPDSARPRVWWHWMNGNVTKEGITADLEWMKRVGIGGFHQFDANIGDFRAGMFSVPKFVDKRIVYRTPEWKEMLRFAASEADILRLGYSLTGARNGPAPPEATGPEVDKLNRKTR